MAMLKSGLLVSKREMTSSELENRFFFSVSQNALSQTVGLVVEGNADCDSS